MREGCGGSMASASLADCKKITTINHHCRGDKERGEILPFARLDAVEKDVSIGIGIGIGKEGD
jgi:hypothetical protein